jgi:hypothetical protein
MVGFQRLQSVGAKQKVCHCEINSRYEERKNIVAASVKISVTASEARQFITAHLHDGWPRYARHDERLEIYTLYISTLKTQTKTAAQRQLF